MREKERKEIEKEKNRKIITINLIDNDRLIRNDGLFFVQNENL